ncbi:MAG: hypothetical protein F4X97_02035 [Boseongicola sp. SB0662_bin_57]|nr:hypothetical protein [Boseongicola sp. SB0662_bin_57]
MPNDGLEVKGYAVLALRDIDTGKWDYIKSDNIIMDFGLRWMLQKIGSRTSNSLTSHEYSRISLGNGTSGVTFTDTGLSGSTVLNKNITTNVIANNVLKLEANLAANEGNFTATEMGIFTKTGSTYRLAHRAVIPPSTKSSTQTGYLGWRVSLGRKST